MGNLIALGTDRTFSGGTMDAFMLLATGFAGVASAMDQLKIPDAAKGLEASTKNISLVPVPTAMGGPNAYGNPSAEVHSCTTFPWGSIMTSLRPPSTVRTLPFESNVYLPVQRTKHQHCDFKCTCVAKVDGSNNCPFHTYP